MMSGAQDPIDLEHEDGLEEVAASFAGKGKGKAAGGVAAGPGADLVAEGRRMLLKNELSLAADCFSEGLMHL